MCAPGIEPGSSPRKGEILTTKLRALLISYELKLKKDRQEIKIRTIII